MPRRLGRILARKDFLKIAGTRRKYVASGLILQVRPSDDPAQAGAHAEGRRVGFTASKKVGNAVCRNRAKRRLRAAVHDVMTESALGAHDYVVIARAETLTRDYLLLKQDLAAALGRLKVTKPVQTMSDSSLPPGGGEAGSGGGHDGCADQGPTTHLILNPSPP